MIPEAVGFRIRASHKHKVLKTIVYFWMTKTLADVCVDTGAMKELSDVKCAVVVGDVVNRRGGRVPEVLTYRGLTRTYLG
jgi:hypothetical protein